MYVRDPKAARLGCAVMILSGLVTLAVLFAAAYVVGTALKAAGW